jgi:alcohol oxidase
VASRLADADASLSILVVESGPDNLNMPDVVHPARFLQHVFPGSKTSQVYVSKKSEHLGGREASVPCGDVLGGGSSINFMTYTRPQRSDFDEWNTPGWTTNEILPYLRKVATQDP